MSAIAELRGDAHGALEVAVVSTPFELTQAAVVLGEQRAWAEALIGGELVEVQPSARHEYANLGEFYRPPAGHLLLARLGDEPVGVIGIRRLDDEWGEGKRLYVRRSARGLGVARRLTRELLELARALGFTSLYVETSPRFTAASYAMCCRLGFREIAKRGSGGHDSFVAMGLRL
jgi:GNAT superfamily N-acetyltransferase